MSQAIRGSVPSSLKTSSRHGAEIAEHRLSVSAASVSLGLAEASPWHQAKQFAPQSGPCWSQEEFSFKCAWLKEAYGEM